jgi:hypothetical protein
METTEMESQCLLVTSERMQAGERPIVFTGGACNIQGLDGPIRNPGRDPLARWLDAQGIPYFDPQIHPSTHGREYAWELDGPMEKKAREEAKLRVYELTSSTIAAVSILEVMDDARAGRPAVVWWNGGRVFAPIGIGERAELEANRALRERLGETAYQHLLAYVAAGRQLRRELEVMLADSDVVRFADSLPELQRTISELLARG